MVTAEIVCLGNELLMGITVNTNATYLGEQLTRLGIEVRRITSVRDDLEQASECIKEVIEREPEILIVTGGLGPTYDDIQMEVISRVTGKRLIENKEALELIKEHYEKYGLEMSEERRKMAMIPEGGKILNNSAGAAPGCLIKYKKTEIFCLPGVPTEVKSIYTTAIHPYLSSKIKTRITECKILIENCRESEIAPYINQTKKKFKKLYVKSHPQFGERKGITIHFSYSGEEGEKIVAKAKRFLMDKIKENQPKIKITEIGE
ncbi:MAG: competence damage-inducible protein A [Candidatus Heimdallarchaeum aukensis]|uniref:Competence damage-inducible protein A n=1 Tax=Candidatus Heimdallarchaeum aukensis TaxID=2876573 RepID=A0A9Y1BK22_9ARCH|nr:MAG: competence damage-inducible protein A [Candidatus Heimdallarchaeum aukensis]